jgi:hypothetical protein
MPLTLKPFAHQWIVCSLIDGRAVIYNITQSGDGQY